MLVWLKMERQEGCQRCPVVDGPHLLALSCPHLLPHGRSCQNWVPAAFHVKPLLVPPTSIQVKRVLVHQILDEWDGKPFQPVTWVELLERQRQ